MAEIRNMPTQARSRQTLDSVMQAADRLFAIKGVDGATNTEIAELAGCSIGSLYRFFPNKEALVSEYVDRYLGALAHELPDLPDVVSIEDVGHLVSDLVDRSIEARKVFKGYERVRLWRYPDGTLASKLVRDSELAMVSDLFNRSNYDLEPELIERMSVVIVDGTWPLITNLETLSKRKRTAMIEEIKFSLTSYISARVTPLISVAT